MDGWTGGRMTNNKENRKQQHSVTQTSPPWHPCPHQHPSQLLTVTKGESSSRPLLEGKVSMAFADGDDFLIPGDKATAGKGLRMEHRREGSRRMRCDGVRAEGGREAGTGSRGRTPNCTACTHQEWSRRTCDVHVGTPRESGQ